MTGNFRFYRDRTVLVTGGTGLIGSPLVALLLEAGARVRVASLDAPPAGRPPFEFLQGDLTDPEFCRRVTTGRELVFHLAGIKGSVGVGRSRAASFFIPTLLMNTQMMEAARAAGVERYLYTSSIAVYQPASVFVEDRAWDGPPHPTDRFAAWAKRMGELQAEAYLEEFGWSQVAIVRPANVYGPRDNFDPATAMVIPALVARAVSGENPLVVWGDGSAARDFIFSRDCAEGMLLALERAAGCIPVNLGSGRAASVREVVDTICSLLDDPPEVVWNRHAPVGNDTRLMDTGRSRDLLGFEARTSLGDGIRETLEWYRGNVAMPSRRFDPFAPR